MNRFPRTVSRRLLLGAFLALQGVVLAGAPVVDALLEAAAPPVVTHAESEDAPPCAPGHDELICQICQVLKLQALPGGTSPHPNDPALSGRALALPSADLAVSPTGSSGHARAPPAI